MIACKSLLGIVGVLALVVVVAGQGGAGKVADAQIAKLIVQLGSDDADLREEASRRLAKLDEALPHLRKAVKSSDAEVRRRASAALAIVESRLTEQLIKETVAEVNKDGLDLFIDRMVRQKGYATPARYKAAMQLAQALAQRAVSAGAAKPAVLGDNLLSLPEVTTPTGRTYTGLRMRIEGTTDPLVSMRGCLLFSSGAIKQLSIVQRSIVFVNGDIESISSPVDSIIICSGTIKRCLSTRGSVIFCNGAVESMGTVQNSAVFVRGELRSLTHPMNSVIEAPKLGRVSISQGNVYLNRDTAPANSSNNDRFKKADPSVLDLFRFFDPARMGLQFTMVDGDVRVDKLTRDKPLARAGLRAGDLILAVSRQKFLTADEFNRLLRYRMLDGKAQLKVQRGDRVLQISVEFAP